MADKNYFQNMTPREKAAWIWEYYHWVIIGGILGAVFVVLIIYQILQVPNDTIAAVTMVDANATEVDKSGYFDDFLTEYGYDPDTDEVTVDDSVKMGEDSKNTTSLQLLDAQFLTGSIDVLLAPQSVFEKFEASNAYADLSQVLDAEILEKYKDKIIYYQPAGADAKIACGILLDGTEGIATRGFFEEAPVAGIASSSKNTAAAKQMMEYLLKHS